MVKKVDRSVQEVWLLQIDIWVTDTHNPCMLNSTNGSLDTLWHCCSSNWGLRSPAFKCLLTQHTVFHLDLWSTDRKSHLASQFNWYHWHAALLTSTWKCFGTYDFSDSAFVHIWVLLLLILGHVTAENDSICYIQLISVQWCPLWA